MKWTTTLFFVLLLSSTSGAQCPDWIANRQKELPFCPEGKSPSLLPETYPLGAVVISDKGFTIGVDPTYTIDVVKKILRGAGPQNPLIVLPVQKESFERIQESIQKMDATEEQKKAWLSSLMRVPVPSYTWQQDAIQPFINPNNGKVILREVENYERNDPSFKKIMHSMQACGFEVGSGLTSPTSHSGTFGGNLETLPGGICVIGNGYFPSQKEYDAYADQVCGDRKDRIVAPTKWMKVAHSDELIKTIRNKTQKAPCDFSVVIASPAKGLELLKQNKNDKFFDPPESKYEKRDYAALRRIMRNESLQEICLKHLARKSKNQPGDGKASQGISYFLAISKSFADELDGALPVDTAEECRQMTNEDLLKLYTEDENLKDYQQLVQKEMSQFRKDVERKLQSKFPQCKVDIIEAPYLFLGGEVVKGKNGGELPKNMGLSLLPNPTNAISVNDTLISPDPQNHAFKNYLDKEYRKRGLQTEYVDTYDYGHMGNGNLHCTTNTIHVCRPRGLK